MANITIDKFTFGSNNYILQDNTSGYITSIPIASSSTLGGVKVGTGLAIDPDTGVLSATGGGGSGSVTSVRVQATSPVQSSQNTAQSTTLDTTISLADAYGDTKNPYGTKTANYVLAGPASGSASAPTFRALVASDIPSGFVRSDEVYKIFVTDTEPSTAVNGDIWIDTDDDSPIIWATGVEF